MSISSRDIKSENVVYFAVDPASLDILPALKEGEALHIHQEISHFGLLSNDQIAVIFEQIASAFRKVYPNNLVIVTAKKHGVNTVEIEVEQGVKTVPVQFKDQNAGSYWFD